MSTTRSADCDGPSHGTAVMDHLVERDRDRRIMAEHDLAQRIADKDDVDPARVDQTGEEVVVCGKRDDLLAAPLHLDHVAHGLAPHAPLVVNAHSRSLWVSGRRAQKPLNDAPDNELTTP